MNVRIRRLGMGLTVCFAALFAMLNYVQVIEADDLNHHDGNTRALVRDFDQPRGSIVTSDGFLLAQSIASDDRYELQRIYPEADLFAHVTGHFGLEVQSSGLERQYNDVLAGATIEQRFASFRDLLVDRDTTANLTLSLRRDVQAAARDALGGRKGAVVVVQPQTGEVIALWSYPSYDPNLLADHDDEAAAAAFAVLDANPDKPLLARSYRDRYFPGSTFKAVTGSAAVDHGVATLVDPVFPRMSSYQPPGTSRAITNFGGTTCGGDLLDLIRVSCNTGFAQLGAELVGPDRLVQTAQGFGFNSVPPLDMPGGVESVVPTDYGAPLDGDRVLFEDTPRLAQVSIGQNDVSATPLQMALVAAGIANRGEVPVPSMVHEVVDTDGRILDEHEPAVWTEATQASAAEAIRIAMIETVDSGTATAMDVPGFDVGGKTGTAQLGTDPPRSHAWIIGFAGPEGEAPTLAIAVLVEADPEASNQTGGTFAAPIARAVLETALQEPTRAAPPPTTAPSEEDPDGE